jgi:hypothetical protein
MRVRRRGGHQFASGHCHQSRHASSATVLRAGAEILSLVVVYSRMISTRRLILCSQVIGEYAPRFARLPLRSAANIAAHSDGSRTVLVQIESRPRQASKWVCFRPPPAPHSRWRAYFYP